MILIDSNRNSQHVLWRNTENVSISNANFSFYYIKVQTWDYVLLFFFFFAIKKRIDGCVDEWGIHFTRSELHNNRAIDTP